VVVNAGTPVLLGKARPKSCPIAVKRAAFSCGLAKRAALSCGLAKRAALSCGLAKRAALSCGLAAIALLCGGRALQNAVAEGDTRTITMHHMHTNEDITITFKREGRYDEAALEKLNWFLRDWRKQQETKMDPHLIDLLWEVQRETGSKEPIWVVCGYRSPETNAMLRRRSSGVARFSQHMLGHATDFYIPGVPLDQLRAIGLRMQRGGVGFYPTSGSPFVHMDTGGIRMWPRMTREQLVRVFPDQRTVYIPSDGRPLAGYDVALADIRKRGDGSDVGPAIAADASQAGGFATVYKLIHMARGNGDEEEAEGAAPAPAAAEPPHSRAKAAAADAVNRIEDKLAAQKAKLAQAAGKAREKAEEKLAAEKAQLAAIAAKAEEKLAAQKDKLAKVAANARVITPAEAAPQANTPNQVIVARGFWQGAPGDTPVARPAPSAAGAIADVARPNRVEVANADATASVPAFANGQDDRVSPDVALAYAAQARSDAPTATATAAPSGPPNTEALRAALIRSATGQPDNATTIAIKRVSGRTASVVFAVSKRKMSPLFADATRLNDPWLRAIMASPSVERSLTLAAPGVRDFRTLAEQMVKPAAGVMMTFTDDPNPGLAYNRFSGSAVVFTPTISYTLRTAQLQ
jgi:uncharacterized protein YcbK (DUF882 family)